MIAVMLAVTLGLPGTCIGCDFAGRDLHGVHLAGVSYIGVDFARTNLQGADLSKARLVGVDFARANLRGADLHDAKLIGSDFSNADLRDANFHNAWLCSVNEDGRIDCADFGGADLHGTDLRGVLVCRERDGERRCEAVDAETLRRASKSNLDGAILP